MTMVENLLYYEVARVIELGDKATATALKI